LDSLLTGPTAIAFVDGDAASVAKALREYAKTNPKLTVKGGVLGNRIMSVADASALADLPPREVVLARLAGALASPMQTFAGLLAAVPRNFAYGLKALLEKRGGAPTGDDATGPSALVEGETSTSADAPAAPPSGSAEDTVVADAAPVAAPDPEPEAVAVEPQPVAAAEAEAVAVEPAPEAAAVAESVAEVVPEPPLPETAPDADEPAAALVADHDVSDPGITLAAEATEPPALEDAAEAASSPALADEPPEAEPLAAHGIPAAVEPKILSVAPEPEVALENDATPIDPPTTPADSPSAD
jgi:large subunit ribosomal protein L10